MPSIGSADLPQRLAPIDTTSLQDAEPGLLVLPAAMRPVEMRLGRALTVDAREDLMPVLMVRSRAGRMSWSLPAIAATRW